MEFLANDTNLLEVKAMPLEIVGFDRGDPCRCKFESCLAHFTMQAKQGVKHAKNYIELRPNNKQRH